MNRLINENVLVTYARLISQKFNVNVIIQGNEFKADNKGNIFIPHFDNIPEATLNVIIGGLLHECGHIKWTDFKPVKTIKSRIELMVWNALEDIFMENKLERKFQGARTFLGSIFSWVDTKAKIFEKNWKESHSSIHDSVNEQLPPEIIELYKFLTEYICYCRKYVVEIPSNKELLNIFESVCVSTPKNTQENVNRAHKIFELLNLKSQKSPHSDRGLEEIFSKEKTISELKDQIKDKTETQEYQDAICTAKEKSADRFLYEDASKDLQVKIENSDEQISLDTERLSHSEKRRDELKQSSKSNNTTFKTEETEHITDGGNVCEGNADFNVNVDMDKVLDKIDNEDDNSELQSIIDELNLKLKTEKEDHTFLKELRRNVLINEKAIRQTYILDKNEINKEILPIRRKLQSQKRELLSLLKTQLKLDSLYKIESTTILEPVISKLYDEYKNSPTQSKSLCGYKESDPDWERILVRGNEFSQNEYNPFSRERDEVITFSSDKSSRTEYTKRIKAVESIVGETLSWLSRLRSPKRTKYRFEKEEGLLSKRDIWKVPAGIGANIFMETKISLVPNAAISILMDCSGSMKPIFGHAQNAALALDLCLKKLNIPHEILGYSTSTEKAYDNVDFGRFSRWVPVRNYVFKSFNSSDASPIFTNNGAFKMHDGVDGESILWAADRLIRRSERTKLIICLTDSQPSCSRAEDVCAPVFGVEEEIRKNTYLVCKQIEMSKIHLFGVGICTNATDDFFKNSIRLNNVEQLPKTICKIITDVLLKTGLY